MKSVGYLMDCVVSHCMRLLWGIQEYLKIVGAAPALEIKDQMLNDDDPVFAQQIASLVVP